jgi:hypothetical protein
MGFFDFLKSKPSKNAILGQVRKAKEIYAQPEYRRMAMEKLLSWGDNESLEGLLERFSVVVQSPHWDEDEKKWLKEEIIKLGKPVLPILKDWVLRKNEINHVVSAYRAIVHDDQEYKALLIEALKERPPSDHRTIQGKQEIIALLAELKDNNLTDIFLPYLDDHSDDVQAATIDAVQAINNDKIKDRLISMLTSDTYSPRILRKVASVICQQKILVGDKKLCDVVLEDYKVQSGYLVLLN